MHVLNLNFPPCVIANPDVCEDGEIRLADGIFNEGRLDICTFGHWGSVCDYNWSFDAPPSVVVCRQLGFQDTCKQ